MALKLNLTGGAGGRQTRTLASGTLSIGRGDRNDWVLADPDRHLSKTHCMLSVENGQYILTDLSTNGVSINGARTPTSRDSRVVLTDGDEFRVGDYSIVVEEVSGAAAASGGAGFGEDSDPLSIDPLADPLGRPRDESFSHPVRHTPQIGRAGRDPFDMQDDAKHRAVIPDEDMFAGRKPDNEWIGPSQADNADANRHAVIRGRVTAPQKSTDVDFDALIGDMSSFLGPTTPAPAPAAYRPQSAPQPAGPAGGRAPAADPFGSFDDLMAPPPAAPAPRAPPPQPAAYAPPPEPQQAPPVQYAPAQPAQAPHHAAAQPPEANPFDANPFQEQPPPRLAPRPATPAPAAPPAPAAVATPIAAAASPGGARAGLDAFLQGANVTRAQTGDDPEEALRAIGQVFRILVEGLREVLMSRAAIKSEMRIEGTLIRSNNNNPLKFSFNPDEAVIALLGSERPGYMPPQRAAKEAFDDIKNHEVAVMAGVQTALRSLLQRFNPETLESRLAQGLLSSMLPAARKARLWENFRELHKTIAAEAQDDFQKVFGDAFAEAYQATSRKDAS